MAEAFRNIVCKSYLGASEENEAINRQSQVLQKIIVEASVLILYVGRTLAILISG